MRALILFLLLSFSAFPAVAQDRDDASLCSPKILPENIQARLKSEFAGWRILEPGDLSAHARERWAAIKPIQCPGIAIGQFESDETAYAVYLVPASQADARYRLVAFAPNSDRSFHETIVERWDGGGATHFFIAKIKVDDFLNQTWRQKLHVVVKEGFIMIDAAWTEYEADVYYWSRGHYLHQPVDY